MSTDALYEQLIYLKQARGKNAKKEFAKDILENEDWREVISLTLNPFITFGVGPVTIKELDWDVATAADGEFADDTFELLSRLSTRDVTGSSAKVMLQEEINNLSIQSRKVFKMVLQKSLDAGCGASTFNKVEKGFIPSFDCMLAHKFEEHRVKTWPQAVEPKYDGVRVLVSVTLNDEPRVEFFSRTGKAFHNFDHLSAQLVALAKIYSKKVGHEGNTGNHIIFDGEIESGSFNKTVGEVRRKDEPALDAVYQLFHATTNADFQSGKSETHYKAARLALQICFEEFEKERVGKFINLVPCYWVNNVEEIYKYYRAIRSKGGEGVIVKSPSVPYVNRRNHGWMKIKANETVDVKVLDMEAGSGKYEGMLGALVVDYKGVEVNVGSGLSDDQRIEFWNEQDEYIGKVVEISYHEETPDGSLRHPVFERFRDKELDA